jgi:glycerophosphoryl diester phosphodiesterase
MLCDVGLAEAAASSKPKIEVQGHRGARARMPENTLEAFDYAIVSGVDFLELDLAATLDNHLVVSHDLQLDPSRLRTLDGHPYQGKTWIREMTLAELKQLDVGSVPNPRFPLQQLKPGARIPTLDEVFELVKSSPHPTAKKVRFNIETKIVPGLPQASPDPETYVRQVYDVIRHHGMISRCVLQSFDHRILKAAKALDPQLKIAALITGTLPNLVLLAKDLKAEYISPEHTWITAMEVQALQSSNVKVVPWTANHLHEWDRLVGLGVDGIITDDPAMLISYLEQKKLR